MNNGADNPGQPDNGTDRHAYRHLSCPSVFGQCPDSPASLSKNGHVRRGVWTMSARTALWIVRGLAVTAEESRVASRPGFGPWAGDLDAAEQAALCCELRTLSLLLLGPQHPLTLARAAIVLDPRRAVGPDGALIAAAHRRLAMGPGGSEIARPNGYSVTPRA
jgi:hypothetical protein